MLEKKKEQKKIFFQYNDVYFFFMLQDIINKITVFEVDINACLSDKRNNLKVLKLIKFVVSESVYLAVWMQFQKLGQLVRKNENDKEIGKEEKKKGKKEEEEQILSICTQLPLSAS